MPGIILTSPVKINLTLRILERRQDGFHNLCSSFFRLPIYETLTISPFFGDISGKDKLAIHGEKVEGKNILFDVLSRRNRVTIRISLSVRVLFIFLHYSKTKIFLAQQKSRAFRATEQAAAILSKKAKHPLPLPVIPQQIAP